jgi:bifunctional non-homologous end joining protein LigD
MVLEIYRKKRNFAITPEPAGRVQEDGRAARGHAAALSFVIQKHRASHLHYDFRLELDGVLLSWAVPKGPSLDPAVKRLAMHVEDHPLEYGNFEGVIPAKQYGAGTVLLWDRGTWIPEEDAREGYRKGKLKFRLEGEKLHGLWSLVRGWSKREEDKAWFLIKMDDEYARRDASDVTEALPRSVASGRDLDEITADPDRVWQSNRSVAENVKSGKVKKRTPKLDPAALTGARKTALPDGLAPQLATLAKTPPEGPDWVHEIKYDGYRMLCRIDRGHARMYSRNGKEWTAQFPGVVAALARLPVKEAWLDGEVVIMQPDGRTSFQALQNALGSGDTRNMVCWLFDVAYLDGYDVRAAPLTQRKALLAQLLEGEASMLRYSGHLEGSGAEVFAKACGLSLEGIVSKRRDSPYISRRAPSWIKVKCALEQEMVVGGYTDPGGSRLGFGALLLGVHDANGDLRYCGKVGTGFNDATLQSLAKRLVKLETKTPPFVDPPRGYEAKGAHWIRPELVAQVSFSEWTRDSTVRHPSFLGLREDKDPREVVLERPVDAEADADTAESSTGTTKTAASKTTATKTAATKTAATKTAATKTAASKTAASKTAASKTAASKTAASKTVTKRAAKRSVAPARVAADITGDTIAGVKLSNPDKMLYPESGHTKRELAAYYATIGEWMLPHLVDRPLTLVRCPNGWSHCFYQKHAKESVPRFVEQVEIEESDGVGVYMMANSVSAIVALLQLGVLELHPWGSRQAHLDRPDRLVFDFDPDEGLAWEPLVEAVELLRALLDNLGLAGFLKTTGGKGLHVVVPVAPTLPWDTIKAFTKAVAELLVQASPQRFTSQLSKSRRGGKIFVDYLRNAEGATAVAAYSTRAKRNAPVSMPIGWSDLAQDLRFDHFNVRNVPGLLAARLDPWADFDAAAEQEITLAMLGRIGVRAPSD